MGDTYRIIEFEDQDMHRRSGETQVRNSDISLGLEINHRSYDGEGWRETRDSVQLYELGRLNRVGSDGR